MQFPVDQRRALMRVLNTTEQLVAGSQCPRCAVLTHPGPRVDAVQGHWMPQLDVLAVSWNVPRENPRRDPDRELMHSMCGLGRMVPRCH